jgi:hypothetical protein
MHVYNIILLLGYFYDANITYYGELSTAIDISIKQVKHSEKLIFSSIHNGRRITSLHSMGIIIHVRG